MNPILEIHEIFDQYESAPNKRELDKRLRELGSIIEKRTRTDREKKINSVLSKGKDMTKNDILFLIGNEVPHAKIRQSIGMGYNAFSKYIKENGMGTKMRGFKVNRWTKEEIELVRDAFDEGKTIDETTLMLKGRSFNAVAQLRSDIRRGVR